MLVATPDPGRLARPHRGGSLTDRYRRAHHVHRGLAGVDRAGAGRSGPPVRPGPTRCCWCAGSSSASPGRSRGRYPVRQQLVRARPARLRDRCVRYGHGRHRAVGVLHAPVRAVVRSVHPRMSSSRRAGGDGAAVHGRRCANSPDFTPNTDPVVPKLKAAAKLPVTWEMSFLYAVVFGGFVAFTNYLPTYIKTIYDFSAVDAGARTAGFALAARAGPADRRCALRPAAAQDTW